MNPLSYLKSINADYIEDLFERYQAEPQSVDESWQYFFDGMSLGGSAPKQQQVERLAPSTAVDWSKELRVFELIQAYRAHGWFLSDVNPLVPAPQDHPALSLERFGLERTDLDKVFSIGSVVGLNQATLQTIVQRLRKLYAGTASVDYVHVQDVAQRKWILESIESGRLQRAVSAVDQQFILKRLTHALTWEQFLHTRFVAQKRFSIEGGEALIPGLDRMFESAAERGITHVCMGMAHRGRLNVLVNICGKKPEHVYTDFDEGYLSKATAEQKTMLGAYDVKYHMGFESDRKTRQGQTVHLTLAHNPSHLEFVDPVVEGMARAKQELLGDKDGHRVLPVLIHGDAAFSGQGVVFETLALSQIDSTRTGGTLHIIVDNQVGFTAGSEQTRSSRTAADLAKFLETPIVHVNGDDPEAMWNAMEWAVDFRQTFKQDVFISLICYRKYGHNEGDEPAFTQPLLTKAIQSHANPRDVYLKRLVQSTQPQLETEATLWMDERIAELTAAHELTKSTQPFPYSNAFEGRWAGFRPARDIEMVESAKIQTGVSKSALIELGQSLCHLPESFHAHPKLKRFFEGRQQSLLTGEGLDWGHAESLAYGTLLSEGHSVRISGQDVERGTFSHRHCILHDTDTGAIYSPLQNLPQKKHSGNARFSAYNSALSETGVLGFEYGWSITDPTSLVVWEAQFGDFSNGAQVIIDQFIASGESKWRRSSGLVMLLPHAFEGQGAEHSSARLERFLQLSALNNWYVVNLSTPAQIFHALRRQLKAPFRKPLIVMSPKSLLRHPLAISSLNDLSQGSFQEMIVDTAVAPKDAERVLLCSGKVYYDLIKHRQEHALNRTAIVRLEQLYPLPLAQISALIAHYSKVKSWTWVQEEPRNMGAWSHFRMQWGAIAPGLNLSYVGRNEASSPAVGQHHVHDHEQEEIVEKAFKS